MKLINRSPLLNKFYYIKKYLYAAFFINRSEKNSQKLTNFWPFIFKARYIINCLNGNKYE